MAQVEVRIDGHLMCVTLNRHEARNALSAQMCDDITSALNNADEQARDTAAIRAVLIRSVGTIFCAGADLGSTTQSDDAAEVTQSDFHDTLTRMLESVVSCGVPVIADIQGPAVGAGMQLALSCDLRLVHHAAWFKIPVASLGFALDGWTINRAQCLLGGGWARSIFLGGATLSAPQAVATGFALEIADSDSAIAYAHRIAGMAPLALRQLKSALNSADFEYALVGESRDLFAQCWASTDAREGQLARKQKRDPVFTGR